MTTWGQLVPGAGRLTNADAEREFIRSVDGQTSIDIELARSIYENGWSRERSFIEVWHDDDNSPAILCGRCDQVTNWKLNSGHFCCKWAGDMYRKYIEQRED